MKIPTPIKVVARAVASLTPDPRNARTHSDEQVRQIANSIERFGWTAPILISAEGMVTAGHGRLAAAQLLGFDKVPCIVLDGLSEPERRALMLADNKIAQNAGWDMEKLHFELETVKGFDFDLGDLGFSAADLNSIMRKGKVNTVDPDSVPHPAPRAISAAGDVWQMGEHRLICGDCTDESVIANLLDGREVNVCVTDPPYGVGFDYNSHDDTRDALAGLVDKFVPLMRARCKTMLITPGNKNQWLYPRPDWTLCWYSSAGVGSGPWGFCCWQPILAYGPDQFLARGLGGRPDAFESNEGKPAEVAHSCPKPVNVWRWIIDRADPTSQAPVLDPFAGSGTTAIVAEMTGRTAYLIEMDPVYVDVIVRRWQDFTGKVARLDGAGSTFDEVTNERTAREAA